MPTKLKEQFLENIKLSFVGRQTKPLILEAAMLEKLPQLLRNYISFCGFVGKPLANNFFLKWKQTLFKTKPNRNWMPLDCQQFNTADPPMRVALMRSKLFGFIPFAGKDKYLNGQGNMLVKLAGLTLVNAKGQEMDQSALLTYLSEAILLPSALLSPNITWLQENDTILQATFMDAGKKVRGKYFFAENGLPYKFETNDRYYSTDGKGYTKYKWTARFKDFTKLGQHISPSELEASWQLDSGEYTYFIGKPQEIRYGIESIDGIKL